MSTRAMYTFKDKTSTVHVYKHHDGYPSGGIAFILKAIETAWTLPRFEADDFAAAFVAANKDGGGGVRLCGTHVNEPDDMSCDSEYHYIITHDGTDLMVTVNAVNWWGDIPQSEEEFAGKLSDAVGLFIG